MNTKNEYKVYFKLHDFDCLFKTIDEILQFSNSSGWNKGDIIPNRNIEIKRKSSLWQINSGLTELISLEDHIDYILNKISPKYKKIISIYDKYKATSELTIVSHHNDVNFGMYLSSDIIEKMSQLKVSLDIDTYYLGEED